jgi:uncharacterized protein (TIGR00369 family)
VNDLSDTYPRASQFEQLTPEVDARWKNFGQWERTYFPKLVGLHVEETRLGYCRMVLTYRDELEQPMGIVHGGAIATLIDASVVPAIGSAYDNTVGYSTIDLHVQYHNALVKEDAVAEGWVTKRGRSVVFCETEVTGRTSGKQIARGFMTYNVSTLRPMKP